jgi:hypothetical protein
LENEHPLPGGLPDRHDRQGAVIKFARTLCPVAVDQFDTAGLQVALAQVTSRLLNR